VRLAVAAVLIAVFVLALVLFWYLQNQAEEQMGRFR